MLVVKIVIIVLFLFVIFSLFQALMNMHKDENSGRKMSQFLGRRLAISIGILLLILLAIALGFISPNARPY